MHTLLAPKRFARILAKSDEGVTLSRQATPEDERTLLHIEHFRTK